MVLQKVREYEDVRGKMIFFSSDKKYLALVETKEGFARGGHYRKMHQDLFLISGKAEYKEKNLETSQEDTRIVQSPVLIKVPPNTANLFIAIEECVFIETLEVNDNSINYPEYRKIVEEKMKN